MKTTAIVLAALAMLTLAAPAAQARERVGVSIFAGRGGLALELDVHSRRPYYGGRWHRPPARFYFNEQVIIPPGPCCESYPYPVQPVLPPTVTVTVMDVQLVPEVWIDRWNRPHYTGRYIEQEVPVVVTAWYDPDYDGYVYRLHGRLYLLDN